MAIPQIAPAEAKGMLDQGREDCVLLDVREPWEYEQVHIPGSRHIPMGELPARLGELNPGHTIVVICHHGNRSQQVANFLSTRGFGRVMNLAGGIDAWAAALDPTLPRY